MGETIRLLCKLCVGLCGLWAARQIGPGATDALAVIGVLALAAPAFGEQWS